MNNILRHRLHCLPLTTLFKLPSRRHKFTRRLSTGPDDCNVIKDAPSTFDEFIVGKRNQSARSIVVQVSSEKSFPELYDYCVDFGTIVSAHHYKMYHERRHYVLIEYSNEAEAQEAIKLSAYNDEIPGVPVRSPFLWFKAGSKKKKINQDAFPLHQVEGTNVLSDGELMDLLKSAQDIENQIDVLYSATRLNDVGVRLRFLAAKQIESSISGMFPQANAQPFGSTVNGCGKMGCDLDLILRLDDDEKEKSKDGRLVFHTKENLSNGRSQTQRQMETIGDIMHLFLPGVCHVRKILQARVPIIKYHHEHLNLEVDLSMNNLSGFYMSELLYIFGEMDNRVRPLIFCIRKWAHSCGLTNPSPGRWITNFSLTCLVIFFLQQLKNPILPPINLLIKCAEPKDMRLTEDGINCTFQRDRQKIPFETVNKTRTSELLLQFYEYYSQFDFANRAISLNEGRSISKPEHSALYIVNPLEQLLNVSKNVSFEECERIRMEVRNSAWTLESEVMNQQGPSQKSDMIWGILNLFKTPEHTIIRPNLLFKSRMVEVSELFEKQEQPSPSLPKLNVEFKNNKVKQQVQGIRLQAKEDLRQIQMNTIKRQIPKGRRR